VEAHLAQLAFALLDVEPLLVDGDADGPLVADGRLRGAGRAGQLVVDASEVDAVLDDADAVDRGVGERAPVDADRLTLDLLDRADQALVAAVDLHPLADVRRAVHAVSSSLAAMAPPARGSSWRLGEAHRVPAASAAARRPAPAAGGHDSQDGGLAPRRGRPTGAASRTGVGGARRPTRRARAGPWGIRRAIISRRRRRRRRDARPGLATRGPSTPARQARDGPAAAGGARGAAGPVARTVLVAASAAREVAVEVLGIDIGGSGIKGAPVDVAVGRLLAERRRLPTPEPADPPAVAEAVARIVGHSPGAGRSAAPSPRWSRAASS
jgi:hypothetical protein